MEALNIPFWNCVAGGSLGALQALIWSIQYPDNVLSCISIAGTSQVSAQAVAFDRVGFEAIIKEAGIILEKDNPTQKLKKCIQKMYLMDMG